MLKNRLKDPSLLAELAYVDGQWIGADDGATLDVIDPASGELLARVPAMQGGETRRAIEAADKAWPAWRARPAAERAALLERWYQAMIDNLDLVARGEFARLKRMCGVDDEDFAEMLVELRSYDPRPGLRFGGGMAEAVVPDILVRAAQDGWDIALNQATLPRLIIDRDYHSELASGADKATHGFLNECVASANWLLKALDQRARTIIRVASEVVRLQQGFFEHGVSQLKPLTLRQVAAAR